MGRLSVSASASHAEHFYSGFRQTEYMLSFESVGNILKWVCIKQQKHNLLGYILFASLIFLNPGSIDIRRSIHIQSAMHNCDFLSYLLRWARLYLDWVWRTIDAACPKLSSTLHQSPSPYRRRNTKTRQSHVVCWIMFNVCNPLYSIISHYKGGVVFDSSTWSNSCIHIFQCRCSQIRG